jgi:hypothetical protein
MACSNCPCPDFCLQRQDFCNLASKSPPDETALRHICARSKMTSTPRPADASFPSLMVQAGNALGALGRAAGAVLTGQAVLVPPEELSKREGECETCEHMLGDRCKLCGCWYRTKIRLAGESCPMVPPKWTAYQ